MLIRSVANQNVGSINKLQTEARTVEGTLNSYTQLVRNQEGKVARAEFARDTSRRGGLFKGKERKSAEAQLEEEQASLQEIIAEKNRFLQSRQHVLYLNYIFEKALS